MRGNIGGRRGGGGISRPNKINLIVHYPDTDDGRRELARRVAQVHAELIHRVVKDLRCSAEQKITLVDAIIRRLQAQSGNDDAV